MKYLLDTHIVLWAAVDVKKLCDPDAAVTGETPVSS